jgi:hypothetical protein
VAEREQELREKEEEVADMLECRRGKLSSHEATLEAEQKHVGDWRADLLAHELIVDLQVNHLDFKEKLLADKEKQLAKKQLHELATIHKRLEGLQAPCVLLSFSPLCPEEPIREVSTMLLLLDSAGGKMLALEGVIRELLEAEGRVLAETVAEHFLTCFRSWDPNGSLELVVWGPIVKA